MSDDQVAGIVIGCLCAVLLIAIIVVHILTRDKVANITNTDIAGSTNLPGVVVQQSLEQRGQSGAD